MKLDATQSEKKDFQKKEKAQNKKEDVKYYGCGKFRPIKRNYRQ